MKFLYRLLFVIIFLSAFAFVVAYARGYRIDIGQKSLVPTGIMSVTSYPKAAKIYVDGVLKESLRVKFALTTSLFTVSPDPKEAIFECGEENVFKAYLLSLEGENLTP